MHPTPPLAAGLACAKVLLLGEHAVVYNQPALAVGIPNSLTACVRAKAPGDGPQNPCRLVVPAWNDLSVDASPDDPSVGRALYAILQGLGIDGRGLLIHVDAHIPPGVGLGSSASLAVALTRALAQWANISLDFNTLDAVCMAAERVFHGAPSGIDHCVAATGGLVRFVKGPRIEPLSLQSPLYLVVGVAAPASSTHRMVSGVRARFERFPAVIEPVIGAIGALVDQGIAALQSGDLLRFGELMDINHGLLSALGVSTPALDQAVGIARAAGALGAKLTGAGGGGCIVALAPDADTQSQVAAALGSVCKEVLCPTLP